MYFHLVLDTEGFAELFLEFVLPTAEVVATGFGLALDTWGQDVLHHKNAVALASVGNGIDTTLPVVGAKDFLTVLLNLLDKDSDWLSGGDLFAVDLLKERLLHGCGGEVLVESLTHKLDGLGGSQCRTIRNVQDHYTRARTPKIYGVVGIGRTLLGALAGVVSRKTGSIFDGLEPNVLLVVVEDEEATTVFIDEGGEFGLFLLELAVGIFNSHAVKKPFV